MPAGLHQAWACGTWDVANRTVFNNDFILQMIRIIFTSRPLGKEDSPGNFILANDVDHLDQPVRCKEIDSIQQYPLVCVTHEIVVQGVASCKSRCSESSPILIIGWTDLLQRGQSRANNHWLCLLLAKNIQYNNVRSSLLSICCISWCVFLCKEEVQNKHKFLLLLSKLIVISNNFLLQLIWIKLLSQPLALGKPSFKKSAVFFNIVQTGGGGGVQTHAQELCCEFCIIQRAIW